MHSILNTAPPLDLLSAAVFGMLFLVTALATARRPVAAVVALIATAPFAYYHAIGATTLTLPKVVLAGAVLGLLWRFRALRWPSRAGIFVGAGLAVAAAMALTLPVADFPQAAAREALKAIEYVLAFAVVAVAYRTDPDEALVCRTIVAVTSLVCVIALFEGASGPQSSLAVGAQLVGRIAGPLEGPNQLSGYLGVALPLLLAMYLYRRPETLVLLAIVLVSATAVLTLSRAGVASTIVASAVVLFWRPSVARARAGVALIAGAAGGLIAGGDPLRFFSASEIANSGGVGTRSQLWHAALALWQAHPWLGVGAGNFELEIGRVGPVGVRTHANSLYLQALVEGGIPLALATLALCVASIAAFVRSRSVFAIGALGAGIGLALHQIFDYLTFYPKVGLWWWIVIGLGVAALPSAAGGESRIAAGSNGGAP